MAEPSCLGICVEEPHSGNPFIFNSPCYNLRFRPQNDFLFAPFHLGSFPPLKYHVKSSSLNRRFASDSLCSSLYIDIMSMFNVATLFVASALFALHCSPLPPLLRKRGRMGNVPLVLS